MTFQCIPSTLRYQGVLKAFDALFQTCTIDMVVGFLDFDTVSLIPGLLNMSQKTEMTLFRLTHWTLNSKSAGDGLRVTITMQRIFASEVMTTYFPSLLLSAITFATTFFKPFFFEAALSVNLTTMLVMTTIFISKMESLPPTSDVKMIDIWLILCQMVPFAEVILLTAMEYNREDKKKGTKKKGKKKTKNSQIATLTVIPIDVAETKAEEPNSKSTFPSLKTLGELNILIFKLFIFPCREKGVTSDCDHQLRCLLWNCLAFLLSALML